VLDPLNPLDAINPFSRAVVHLAMYFNREPDLAARTRQELSTGTGFIYRSSYQYFLVTARHNLTGRHPDTKKRSLQPAGFRTKFLSKGILTEQISNYTAGPTIQTIPTIAIRVFSNIRPIRLLMLLYFHSRRKPNGATA
jgi:hypothetical protein